MKAYPKENQETAWNLICPYTAMLRDYRAAADRLSARLAVLRRELRDMEQSRRLRGALPARKALERRIMLLRDERADLESVMRILQGYADAEVRS